MAMAPEAGSGPRALLAQLLALRRSAGALIMSEPDPANQHVPEHHPVAHQAVKWVLERSGAVFFKKEVTDPSKAVTYNRYKP